MVRKRYIPAFIAEGIAVGAMLYNVGEILAKGSIWHMRPGIWAFGLLMTIATAPAFIMWMMERRR